METRTAPPGAKNAFGADVGGQTFLKPPRRGSGGGAFATFMILCRASPTHGPCQSLLSQLTRTPTATSFFLGILYSQFPYDYPILWAPPAVVTSAVSGAGHIGEAAFEAALNTLEGHVGILLASPPLIPRILHIVIATGLLGFFLKLLHPSESNLLFDGASLALYVVGIVVYITNIVKGMRMAATGHYATPDEIILDDSHPYTPAFEGKGIGRADSLRVLSASHTILALILVGILVLQAGQWYAERKESQDIEAQGKLAVTKGKTSANAGGAGGGSSVHGKEKKRA